MILGNVDPRHFKENEDERKAGHDFKCISCCPVLLTEWNISKKNEMYLFWRKHREFHLFYGWNDFIRLMFNFGLHVVYIDKETILLTKMPLDFIQSVWISYVEWGAVHHPERRMSLSVNDSEVGFFFFFFACINKLSKNECRFLILNHWAASEWF